MPKHTVSGLNPTRTHKLSAAGVAAVGAAALVFAVVPGADAGQGKSEAVAQNVNVKPVAFSAVDTAAQAQQATIAKQADASAAQGKAEAAAAKEKAEASAKAKAEQDRKDTETASRSAIRTAIPAAAPTAAPKSIKTYGNTVDSWIRQSLNVMAQHGIPGSYNGIYRNLMRESSGNPMAINLWDSNAAKGIPSKGLLQVIDPTFRQYHVPGTSWNIYDPVANITAACKYAAAMYGSMDNVNSAY
ncbi:transglycosylase SLT domain-containing protein [Streptomyces sp. CT34]|uniref:transglycosylase SLT domain-containing protein n=1 Tax=Streptomyces sp. CT34 TaxID=1553907 RepID=UPI0005B7904B|nr:transglycosylase SLT domain-containing protein [Streptomyces sp. CT34]